MFAAEKILIKNGAQSFQRLCYYFIIVFRSSTVFFGITTIISDCEWSSRWNRRIPLRR